jgi:[protein-PII] uridylyltransferase
MSFPDVDNQRAIIDRRAIADRIAALRGRKLKSDASAILLDALAAGRAEIARRIAHDPGRGRAAARATTAGGKPASLATAMP